MPAPGAPQQFRRRLRLAAIVLVLAWAVVLALAVGVATGRFGDMGLPTDDEGRPRGLLVIGVAVAAAALATTAAYRRISGPVGDLLHAAEQVTAGEYSDVDVAVRGPQELRLLTATFNEMTSQLAAGQDNVDASSPTSPTSYATRSRSCRAKSRPSSTACAHATTSTSRRCSTRPNASATSSTTYILWRSPNPANSFSPTKRCSSANLSTRSCRATPPPRPSTMWPCTQQSSPTSRRCGSTPSASARCSTTCSRTPSATAPRAER